MDSSSLGQAKLVNPRSQQLVLRHNIQGSYQRIINLLTVDPQRYFGKPNAPTFLPVEFVSRPASHIIKCCVLFEASELYIYIKFFLVTGTSSHAAEQAVRRLETDVEITSLLYERLRGNPAQSVPRIVAWFPEEKAVVTEESKGDLLLNIIDNDAAGYPGRRVLEKLETHCYSVGRWLEEFQRITATNTRITEVEREIIGYVDLRLKKLWTALNLAENEYRAVLTYLQRELRNVRHTEMYACGVHGDFGLSNILVGSHQVTVLDFAMYNIGLPYTDPSYLYQRMEGFLTKPLFRRDTITFLQRAFLEGYQRDFDLKHPLFKVFRVRHMVNRLVDLANTNGLTTIKRLYQCWQYKKCLDGLKQIVTNS
jgi:hypothetical protein